MLLCCFGVSITIVSTIVLLSFWVHGMASRGLKNVRGEGGGGSSAERTRNVDALTESDFCAC